MLSHPVFGKSKMNYFEYIFGHAIPTGIHNFRCSLYFLIKLHQGDTSDYDFFDKYGYSKEDKFKMLREEFFDCLEDNVMEKEAVEYLYELSEEVVAGKVETVKFDFDEFENLMNDLVVEEPNEANNETLNNCCGGSCHCN